ncbi:MAG: hypothetical protein WBS33_03930 [Verrucomicrobiia bacterium]
MKKGFAGLHRVEATLIRGFAGLIGRKQRCKKALQVCFEFVQI